MAAPIQYEPIINVDSDTESEYIPSDSDSDYEDSETDDDTVAEDLSFLDANKIIV